MSSELKKAQIRVVKAFIPLILIGAMSFYLGDDPSKFPDIFSIILIALAYFLIGHLLLFRFTWFCYKHLYYIIVRPDLNNGWFERADVLRLNIANFLFWKNWFVFPLIFLLFNSWYKDFPDKSLLAMITILVFHLIEASCKIKTINWHWKEENDLYEFSMRKQLYILIFNLFIGPILIISIYYFEWFLIPIKTEKVSADLPAGWGIYIISFLGLCCFFGYAQLLWKSFRKPKEQFKDFHKEIIDDIPGGIFLHKNYDKY